MIAVAALLSALLLFSATPHTLSAADQCANTDSTMPSDKAKQFVQDKITTNKVVVFSKTYCPFCLKAKKALGQFIQPDQMEVVELDNLPAGDNIIDIQDALYEVTGARSVPRVFIGGKFIGGGDDTAAKAANGELKELLAGQGLLKA